MDRTNDLFPKVLILGLPFNLQTGGGITMSNLFRGWPKDRIAVASVSNMQVGLDTGVCKIHYQLGYGRKLHPFPLNLFLPEVPIGPVEITEETGNADSSAVIEPGKFSRIYNLVRIVLHFLGLFNLLYRIKVTPEFRKWLEDFKPDVIYSQLSTLELIRQVNELHEITGKPVVIHMMDDWPKTINRPGLFGHYWKRIIDSEFRGLLNKSALLMSIGDAMSEEYHQRYGKEFVPFHNPIETGNWIPNSKTDYSLKGKFTILYAGRIGIAVKNSVRNIAMAVNSLAGKGHSLVFEIQTSDAAMLKSIVDLNENVRWMKPISYHDLPKKFSSADLLVLPHDFDRKSIDFLRFSFSTKVTEYMISGTPVLVYADKETALARGAMKTEWAYVVTEDSPMVLEKAILELMGNQDLRRTYGERAKKLAAENEDASLVREKFRTCFRDLMGKAR